VLVPANDVSIQIGPAINDSELNTLRVLVGFENHTATSGAWRKAVINDGEPIKSKTFQNHRQALVDYQLVESIAGNKHDYRATEAGLAMAKGMPFESHWHSPTVAATATPLKGGAGGTGEASKEAVQSTHQTADIAGTKTVGEKTNEDGHGA
jgi:hypothetical protein